MNCKLLLESDETTAGFIKRIFHMMEQILFIGTSLDTLFFNERMLRQSPGFTSLCQRDYLLKKLSQRRRNATFGSINKMMRPDWSGREETSTWKIYE
jgi:hypothetical protein